MTDSHNMIVERVVSLAERLEEIEGPEDIDFLDAKLTVGIDGSVREVTIIVTTGGPHLEADCWAGVVRGSWGGESHTTHTRSGALDDLGSRIARRFEENVVA